MNLIDAALNFALAAASVAMVLCAWRLLRGPETTDRLLYVRSTGMD